MLADESLVLTICFHKNANAISIHGKDGPYKGLYLLALFIVCMQIQAHSPHLVDT